MTKQLIKVDGDTVTRYSLFDLKRDHPGKSFPKNQNSNALSEFGCYWAEAVPQQDYDRSTYNITDTYELVDGVWKQKWVLVEKTDEEKAAFAQTRMTEIQEALQQRLDDFARTREYDGILSACTYATSEVQKFADEAAYCVGIRDATWAASYQILTDYQAGDRELPTVAGVLAEISVPSWPE